MIGLGIETTCDETSIALVEDGKRLIHCEIYSQIETHAAYRGVVPEIASRAHLEKINLLLDKTMKESGVEFSEIAYIAVANRPGLMGSLLMGGMLARCISLVHSIPIVPVDHLESHLTVIRLEEQAKDLELPVLGLLLSGGNSSIYLHRDWGVMERVADTLDDALGEAFDKAASILGLGYPGGPYLEKEANQYFQDSSLRNDYILPRLLKTDSQTKIQFSFSGLKTALLYARRDHPEISIERLSFEFQERSFELVIRNLRKAVDQTGIKTIVAGGGVLANQTLRGHLDSLLESDGIQVYYPSSKILCTDNGAMVATLGYYLFQKGITDSIDFKMSPKRLV